MKRIILIAFIISSINCSYESCVHSSTNCNSYDVDEINGFSCYLLSTDTPENRATGDQDDFEGCIAFPETADYQKIYWRLVKGAKKESLSTYERDMPYIDLYPKSVLEPTKDFFNKDEVVYVNYVYVSDADNKIINSANTCYYKMVGKIKYEQNGKFLNITDKNECFNTQLFPDFRNLLNCGYSTITFNISGEISTINTCFFIPDNHLPTEFFKMFHEEFVVSHASKLIAQYKYEGPYALKSNTGNKQRKLQENYITYEVEVEDRFGKKYKYNKYNYTPEIIEEGLQGNQYIFDENGTMMISNCGLILLIIMIFLF